MAKIDKAMKFDQGKPPIDLIDSTIILELAKVLGYGAEKYEAHNWKIGLPISRYYSACMRHLLAFNDGETIDPESGLNHLGHAACNIMFMLYMLKHKPELDDRPSTELDLASLIKKVQNEIEKKGGDFSASIKWPGDISPDSIPAILSEDAFDNLCISKTTRFL